MPEGTKVDRLYKKLLAEGHDEESAARIAQSQTGLSLQTGKPPKGKENKMSEHFENGKAKALNEIQNKAKAAGIKIQNEESGIEGNLPSWPGASAVYSRAYALMKKYGADYDLIKALGKGDEEKIKAILLYHYAGK